jgi:hypothetical protein
MIDLYYWTTPNGHKPVNISKGEQFKPEFFGDFT